MLLYFSPGLSGLVEKKLHEIKKKYRGFHIQNIRQILKRIAKQLHQALTSYF